MKQSPKTEHKQVSLSKVHVPSLAADSLHFAFTAVVLMDFRCAVWLLDLDVTRGHASVYIPLLSVLAGRCSVGT